MTNQTEMKMHPYTSKSLFASPDIGVRIGVRPLPLRSRIARILSRFREYRRYQRDYQKLSAMSDHELKDIGLTRGDVMAAYGALPWPFSRPISG